MTRMENWGLITYRTTAVLFDEKASDIKYKNRVAYVVAHELAHQYVKPYFEMQFIAHWPC
jgi:aminopeptidase N